MRSWEAVRDEFDALGIERVGISTDTVAQAAGLQKKHGITMRLLSDAALTVTDLYHLRYSDGKTPIVTTIFIGADGLVRWIDVAPDYRKRNDGAFVLEHVTAALAAAEPPGSS